jgi:hypothetical protein
VTLRSLLVIRLGAPLWARCNAVALAAVTLGADLGGIALQANQSFERTGLGARGSLRSVIAVLARRSTQIR